MADYLEPTILLSLKNSNDSNSILFDLPNNISQVPPYTLKSIWWIGWMVIIEYITLWIQHKKLPVFHDNILCFAYAIFYELTKILIRGFEYGTYSWVFNNYAIFQPPKDSILTMFYLVILVDFGYYWFHRAAHEIMLLWAIHQVHHSSQDLTISVGLRHSPIQRLFSWLFYIPLAIIGIPPSYMLAHVQFNLLYQCWIHTEVVSTLGPLEYILNTPCHHRVHHASNLYCLDKNYGGVLIIWDHIFGTFQAPQKDKEIAYGILFQPSSFEPIYNLVFYFKGVMQKILTMENYSDKLSCLIKGPSWLPGAPWTGWDKDKIDIQVPRHYRAANAHNITHLYSIIHLCTALYLTSTLNDIADNSSPMMVTIYSIIIVGTLTSIGIIYDKPPYTCALEISRCVMALCACVFVPTLQIPYLLVLYTVSLFIFLFKPNFVLSGETIKQE